MKFLTLEPNRLAALIGDTVVDIASAAEQLSVVNMPTQLTALIEADESTLATVWRLATQASQAGVASRPYAHVKPMAPIPVPRRNIFCIGKNYLDHAREVAAKMNTSAEAPPKPIIFTKATTAVIGPGDPIPSHSEHTAKLDYETELALVIGRGGRDINRDDAWEHVFGYTIINDVSARDLQKDHLQWFRAKSLDGFAPMGPLLVTRDEMPAPAAIRIQCWVNGELRQDDTFDHLIFDVPELIAVISAGTTLLAGDIIATGTPAGVGMGFTPARFLRPGDQIKMKVTGAGTLTNPVA